MEDAGGFACTLDDANRLGRLEAYAQHAPPTNSGQIPPYRPVNTLCHIRFDKSRPSAKLHPLFARLDSGTNFDYNSSIAQSKKGRPVTSNNRVTLEEILDQTIPDWRELIEVQFCTRDLIQTLIDRGYPEYAAWRALGDICKRMAWEAQHTQQAA